MDRLAAPERAAVVRAAVDVRPKVAVVAATGVVCQAFAGVAGQVARLDH